LEFPTLEKPFLIQRNYYFIRMKISAKMKKALNDQVRLEADATNNYLAMASWCEVTGYEGAASYFYAQSDEERTHMLKIVHYLNDMGAIATISATKAPATSYKSLETLIKTALKNEQAVTKAIHKMVEISQRDKDHSTYAFLEWFVNEQVQEETKFETLLQKFDLIGRDKLAINEIDKLLASQATASAEPAA
jgi:ferritin